MKIPRADDTRPRGRDPKKPPHPCQCRNHLGRPKHPHKTREAAVADAIRKTGWSGSASVYKCPTSDRWHVTTRGAPNA